ncbi:TPA: divalent-cation tolerance protein CutA [Candidatus Woesearchaeota archaeon]|nr:CutA1 divalent ion tolerance protein [archaeon GW2011_AR15]MBS3103653.1 divalent-cation tolerance protein CutA [Candidatus Woesearchaeota archaeon]HIH41746.1 divalent-cation tolerance protein CutA [Candidatus Woesearchaeota archaeon]
MRLVYITARNSAEAKKISGHLLKKKLAGCVNIFPVESMYWWDGEMQEDVEFVLLVKTANDNFERIEKAVLEIHSYEIPAIYSWKVDKISRKYDEWISKNSS